MYQTHSRRGRIRLASYLAALFVVLVATASIGAVQTRRYKTAYEESQQRALLELGEYMDHIESDLSKVIYTNTPPMLAKLSSSLWREATGAKSSLSQLPTSDLQMDNTYRFLSQVGEYAMSLNRKVADGGTISNSERETLEKLLGLSRSLCGQLATVSMHLDNGTLDLEQARDALSQGGEGIQTISLSQSFSDAEQALADYPTLIYDGPFSDHINQKSPAMLQGKSNITREEAAKIASKFSGIAANNLQEDADEDGNMASYGFFYDTMSISITKAGGYLCYMLNSRFADEATLEAQDAISRAAAFLKEMGFENMKDSYYALNDGICVVNFAQMEGDAICYPDLIKVGVALDNGEIVSVDARGYLMNHKDRVIPTPKITKGQAQQRLSPKLTVLSSRLAFIPTDAGGEVYCYEFRCKGQKEDEILVYINAQTGDEANILQLLHADGGMLTR